MKVLLCCGDRASDKRYGTSSFTRLRWNVRHRIGQLGRSVQLDRHPQSSQHTFYMYKIAASAMQRPAAISTSLGLGADDRTSWAGWPVWWTCGLVS